VSRLGASMLGVLVFSGCAHYNTLYNSERLYQEAEGLRVEGNDSTAEQRYRDVVRKTADAYRSGRTGDRSARTLFLLGRAQLRIGQPREARGALAQAASLMSEPGLRPQILVYQALASARIGEEAAARTLLEEAFAAGLTGRPLGEAHLLRGRLRLSKGNTDDGWDDLDQAAGADPGVAVEAGVERLGWSIRYGDLSRARYALERLLLMGEAGERLDTISVLTSSAAAQWSPSVAATLLGDVDSAPWDPAARSRLGLQQAKLLHLAGDTAAAEAQAWRVARGRGQAVAQARILLSTWRLDRTRDLNEAQAVVPILLPAGDDPSVVELLEAVEALHRYSDVGLDQPLGWFAAAEVARDRLGAPILARGLFLAYADTDPSDAWAPKALLAALNVSVDREDQTWLRGRLEAHRNSPYVQAARGESASGFEALEEELRVRLSEIATR
jgi:tetratricopeptide (TPR) repeat protein